MRNFGFVGATVAASLAVSALAPSAGSAHINPLAPLKSRGGDQKASPCDGEKWGSGTVYTFQPGATVTLGVSENVSHPGYYRIAFDRDATPSFKDPDSITSKSRPCKFNEFDRCDRDDFCTAYPADTGVTILWDELDPHVPAIPLLPGPDVSWTIKLPDVECEKCTIQIIQVMEDTIHGPYCPKGVCPGEGTDYVEDIYHRCIDVTLKKGATNSATVAATRNEFKGRDCTKATMNDAGVVMVPDASVQMQPVPEAGTVPPGSPPGTATPGTATPGTTPGSTTPDAGATGAGGSLDNNDGSSDDGGCSVRASTGSQPGLMALFALASVLMWRRRRARG